MPIAASLDPEARIVRLVLTGTLTLAEMTSAIDAIVRQVRAEGGYDLLSNHRGVDTPITVEQLEGLVDHVRRRAKALHGQRFSVVTATAASFGMMRMLSVMAQRIPMEVNVFQDMAEAERWLAEPHSGH